MSEEPMSPSPDPAKPSENGQPLQHDVPIVGKRYDAVYADQRPTFTSKVQAIRPRDRTWKAWQIPHPTDIPVDQEFTLPDWVLRALLGLRMDRGNWLAYAGHWLVLVNRGTDLLSEEEFRELYVIDDPNSPSDTAD